jgi:phosphate starvation-inducible PhoH-like protein
MKKASKRKLHATGYGFEIMPPPPNSRIEPLLPRTAMQSLLISAIASNTLVFALGPAGTGKTYVAAAMAADALVGGCAKKVMITRPALECGDSIGFLPGDLKEKYQPYLRPFASTFAKRLGTGAYKAALSEGSIEPVPLGFMRGDTFDDCWVILDEAQNTDPRMMLMFLTRIGQNCKVVVTGDAGQKDIRGLSGLEDAVHRLSGIPGVAVVRFTAHDVVRSGIVKSILMSYGEGNSAIITQGP